MMNVRSCISVDEAISAAAFVIQPYSNVAIHNYITISIEQGQLLPSIDKLIHIRENITDDYVLVPVGQRFNTTGANHAIWLVFDAKEHILVEINSLGTGGYNPQSSVLFNHIYNKAIQESEWSFRTFSSIEVQGPFDTCRLISLYLLSELLHNRPAPSAKVLQTHATQTNTQRYFQQHSVPLPITMHTRTSATSIVYRPRGHTPLRLWIHLQDQHAQTAQHITTGRMSALVGMDRTRGSPVDRGHQRQYKGHLRRCNSNNTKTGKPCRRRLAIGEQRCHLHAADQNTRTGSDNIFMTQRDSPHLAVPTIRRCGSRNTKSKKPCRNYVSDTQRRCRLHP